MKATVIAIGDEILAGKIVNNNAAYISGELNKLGIETVRQLVVGDETLAITEALEIARLGDVVDELSEGLDTMMGENGTRLSGGQRQRLALARAIVGKPELLLLDEATSALDNESERLVQQAIEAIAENFTVVVIAHRLSTIRRADMVHVMKDGRIVQRGTYDELLGTEGSFQRLHGLELT